MLVPCTNALGQQRYIVNFNLDTVPMKAVQLRMARAAVGWGVRDLAKQAGVTANTVTRIENGADAKQSTIDALKRALEAVGIEFTNGEQPGVRLSKEAGVYPSSLSELTVARRKNTKPIGKRRKNTEPIRKK